MVRLLDILHADRGEAAGLGRLHVLLTQASASGLNVRFTPPAAAENPPDSGDSSKCAVSSLSDRCQ